MQLGDDRQGGVMDRRRDHQTPLAAPAASTTNHETRGNLPLTILIRSALPRKFATWISTL